MEQVGSVQPPARECQARTEPREEQRDGADIRAMTSLPGPGADGEGRAGSSLLWQQTMLRGKPRREQGANGNLGDHGHGEKQSQLRAEPSPGVAGTQRLPAKASWSQAHVAHGCSCPLLPCTIQAGAQQHPPHVEKRSHAQRQPQAQDQYGPKEGAGLGVRAQVAPNRQGKTEGAVEAMVTACALGS